LLEPDSLLNVHCAQAKYDKLIEDNPYQSQTVEFCDTTGEVIETVEIPPDIDSPIEVGATPTELPVKRGATPLFVKGGFLLNVQSATGKPATFTRSQVELPPWTPWRACVPQTIEQLSVVISTQFGIIKDELADVKKFAKKLTAKSLHFSRNLVLLCITKRVKESLCLCPVHLKVDPHL
jgi:hypothetical protein